MIHHRIALWALVYLLAFPTLHCGTSGDLAGTEIGNPNTVALSIVGVQGSNVARSSMRFQTGSVSLERVLISISNIEFVPTVNGSCEEEAQEIELAFEGPYFVNLLTNESKPNLGIVEIPNGDYCELELKIEKMEANEIPADLSPSNPLIGNSIYVEGLAPDNTPFIVKAEFSEEFQIETSGETIVVSEKGLRSYLIAFVLDPWFSSMDFSIAEKSGGKILINKDSNQALLEELKASVKASARLFKDEDLDGELDDDEDDESIGEGTELD